MAADSGAAKRPRHPLLRMRRQAVLVVVWLLFVRLLEHSKKPLEWTEIILVLGRSNRLLHPVVARDEERIHGVHGRTPLREIRAQPGETDTPAPGPRIESSRLVEKIAGTCPCPGSALGLCASFGSGAPDQLITERAKSKRKVGSLLGHDPQQIEREGHILLS